VKTAIDIHNYEEFFLLYADDELTAAQREQVERFVDEHPRLKDELKLFCELKMPPEELVFPGKESLMRQSAGPDKNNYERYFLLYADNELTAAARKEVETFVLQHPSLQDEFLLLQEAKLPVETVICPDKQSLYKSEKEEKPVILMYWKRIAVAAVLAGLAIMTWLLLPGVSVDKQNGLAVNSSNASGSVIPDQKAAEAPVLANQHADVQEPQKGQEVLASNETGETAERPTEMVRTTKQQENNSPAIIAAAVTPKAEQVLQARDNVAELETPKHINAATVSSAAPVAIAAAQPIEENTTAALVRPAVYKELNTEDEDKSLYLGSLEINKDKLRGFFRKAGSLFRGKAKQQEEDRNDASPSSSNTRSLR
jgi:hypothetical protein